MKKRRILFAALIICFLVSSQEANADKEHIKNQNLINENYADYSNSEGGVLQIEQSHINEVTGSTFKNNTATSSGGAVYNAGTLHVGSSTFESNKAEQQSGKGDGGAIYNNGELTVENSSFSNNRAGKGNEDWYEEGHGGAVYNNKNATITNSTFTGNHARYGGAIYNDKNSSLTVQGTFTENTAQTGGAILNNSELTVKSGSVFENNKATRFDGGAIDNEDGNLNIEDNVTFKNNTAVGEDEYGGQRGGAIFSESDGNSQVQIGKGVTFEGNKAEEGGGIYLFKHNNVEIGDNAAFKNNQAKRDGGAIGVYTFDLEDEEKASSLKIGNNALFEENQAGFDDEEYAPENNVVFGGALSFTDTITTEENRTVFSIGNNAIFRNNKAGASSSLIGYGGALYNAAYKTTVGDNVLFEKNISGYGGALYNSGNITIGQNAIFNGNIANLAGGAIYNSNILNLGDNAVFDGNSAVSMGGAIFNWSFSENNIQKAAFLNNKSQYGGAVYAYGGTLNITDSIFDNNSALSDGGALFNQEKVNVKNSLFENNTANSRGGAIYNLYNDYTQNGYSYVDYQKPQLTVENSQFTKNKAMVGGAIASSGDDVTTVKNSYFNDNFAAEKADEKGIPTGGQGGAIWTGATASNTLNVESSVFENNTAEAEGGAIWSGGETKVTNSVFRGNKTTGNTFTEEQPNYQTDKEGGGAIFVGSSSKAEITKSDFINNSSATVGGAIATRSNAQGDTTSLNISESTFNGNSAEYNGGAIATYTDTTITDTSFVNNKAGKKGGAIWANGNVTIKAENSDVIFSGNSAADGADIYMDTESESVSARSARAQTENKLKLQASENRNIILADGISGAQEYNVELDGDGTVTFNGEIKNANMSVTKGTLHLAEGSSLGTGTNINITNATLDSQDGRINDYSDKVKIGSNSILKFDLSSANKTTDKFSAQEGLETGSIKVEDFNFLPDTTVSSGSMTLSEIQDSLGLGDVVELELPEKSFKALTPLRYVNVKSGEDGVSYTAAGNSYSDFNPAVMAAPVAAQLGGYLTQLDSYDEAFRNMDMYMIMPKSMRQSMKYKNKYAQAGSDLNLMYDKSLTPYSNTSLWARPYATFENVRLKQGPKVSNVSWGSYLGGDSEMYELKNGWEAMWSLYAGYNGSHQAYNGVSIYQNGGTLGLTGTLYKNNFFTGLTANAGANAAEASTMYGDDAFSLFRTGVASKTGYNLEFADGKFIIQPSWLMSYSFINTEDYTTSGGIKINSSPLSVMQLEPGLKFIGNTRNGWQPYTGLSIVWNLFDKTDFIASDATLPELSVKPFFKYGLGLRKLCGERFAGYGQTYFTSGGRNGVGFQFGGRWTI